jgi:diadenosine tetraphosphate (Ap4A) HIT family hydrolase
MTLPGEHTQQAALAEFSDEFGLEALHLADCGTWVLSLRPGQLTLGSMVLSIRSGAFNLADLTSREGQDMAAGFALAENLARDTYGAVRINLLCLMMQDPIVHFHIFPRYDRDISRHGVNWQDMDWPGAPLLRPVDTPEPILHGVLSEMRNNADRLPDIFA